MNATELIEQIAALPPRERTHFDQLFHSLENGAPPPVPVQQGKWPDFTERLRRIYGDRVAPDSQAIIDEGRGDV